jgi:hypothetical protein
MRVHLAITLAEHGLADEIFRRMPASAVRAEGRGEIVSHDLPMPPSPPLHAPPPPPLLRGLLMEPSTTSPGRRTSQPRPPPFSAALNHGRRQQVRHLFKRPSSSPRRLAALPADEQLRLGFGRWRPSLPDARPPREPPAASNSPPPGVLQADDTTNLCLRISICYASRLGQGITNDRLRTRPAFFSPAPPRISASTSG